MNDLDFLNDDSLWPSFPLCPVTRTEYGLGSVSAVVVTGVPVCYEVNLFSLQTGPLMPQLQDATKHIYNSFEEMVADGWRID